MDATMNWIMGMAVVLGCLLAAGCGCGMGPGPWGNPPPAYPSGYGAACPPGGAMTTTAPPANYAPVASGDSGWRPAQQ